MSETSPRRRDTSRRGGFTLLEVAIALVIFVFGALAIIRIFPPALGVIQNSGDQLTAVNLNRSTQARFARQPGLVPDAIYDPNPDADWRDNIVGSVAGTPRRNNSLPIGNIQNLEMDYSQSALGHFKNIVGERHIVPSSPSDPVVLTQFPYSSIAVYEEDSLTGVTVTKEGTLDFTQAIQTSTGVAPSLTTQDRAYVSYRWVEGGRVWAVGEEPLVNLTASPLKVSQSLPSRYPNPVTSIVAGEVTVRLRKFLGNTPSTNAAAGQLELTSAEAGKNISVDYAVPDWRWMVYDGVPNIASATGTERYLNLPVRPLDELKSPAYSYALYPSLTASAPSGVTVNPKLGQVNFTTVTSGSKARIVYWTLDNWAQQLSVAARSYLLNYGTASAEPWRDCVLVGNILHFKPSEAGKSVSVSYSYRASGATTDTEVKNQIMTIDDDIIDIVGGNRVSELKLTDITGNELSTPVTAIQQIRGISIQARTAWLNGSRFAQSSLTGYRGVQNP